MHLAVANVTLAAFPRCVFPALFRHTAVTVFGADDIHSSHPVPTAMGPSITQKTTHPTKLLVTLWSVVLQHQSIITIVEMNTD